MCFLFYGVKAEKNQDVDRTTNTEACSRLYRKTRLTRLTCTPDIDGFAVGFPKDDLRAHKVWRPYSTSVDALFALIHPAGQLDGHSETT